MFKIVHALSRCFKSRMEAAGIGAAVINTLKFKAVNEPVKKADRHDAATIREFLEKDMLPESRLCGKTGGELRRLLKARTTPVRAEAVMDRRGDGGREGAAVKQKRA
jgi:hypothetical protein